MTILRYCGSALAGFFTLAAAAHLYGAGAKTPFATLEAEAGQLAGGAKVHAFVPGSPVPKTATLELEASGNAYVRLQHAGDSISWTNPVAGANAIVVRSSLPDTPSGGGMTATLNLYVDGKFRQALSLSSRQSWVYRTKDAGWIDDPTQGGMPFKFYNEDHAFIAGSPLVKGSILMLKMDADDTAPEYDIDCIDLEPVAQPLPRPLRSLSIADFGAVPNSDQDCQKAIQDCVDAARKQNRSVWIPTGTWKTSSIVPHGLDFTGVTVHGAGMWYATLYRQAPISGSTAPPARQWSSRLQIGSHTTVTDFSIDSNSVRRALGKPEGGDYGVLTQGESWLVQRIWVRHCDANWCSGTDGMIRDCRVADSWGDGINLNNGNSPNPTHLGIRLTAENNFVRGTGDDGLATYSDRGSSGKNGQMTGTQILNNTAVAPYWANCLRVAGGRNVVVRGNLLLDSASNSGMTVGVFGKTGQPLESAIIEDNEIHHGGGWNGADRHGLVIGSAEHEYTDVIVRNNIIYDSLRAGIFVGPRFDRITLQGNRVIHPATTGIEIGKNVTGQGEFHDNNITGLNPGQAPIKNDSPATFKF